MFFAHISTALIAKPLAKKVSLGVLLLSSQLIDILSGIFLLIGLEYISADGNNNLAWSHGLFMASLWTIIIFSISLLISKKLRTSLIISLVFFSHWILDFISHPMGMGKIIPRDLPLFFNNSVKIGLGLYNSVPLALITEFGLFIGSIIFYLIKTKAVDKTGKWIFWLLPAFLIISIIPIGMPAPFSYMTMFVMVLLLPIGIWIDKHRSIKST